MHRTRNLIIILVALAIIVVIAVVASRGHRKDTLPVAMQTIKYGSFSVKLPENGTVMRPRTRTIPTLVAGNIARIYVRAGQSVSAGQLLATILNPALQFDAAGSQADYSSSVANVTTARIDEQNARVQYQAAVATAKSNLDEAQRVYNADNALLQNKAIARNTVDADKAKLDQAQVAYDQAVNQLKLGAVSGYGQNSVQEAKAAAQKAQILNAQNQQQLGYTQIVAPDSGVIQTIAAETNNPLRNLSPGDAVTAGQELFTMSASDKYIVKAQVDEQDIVNVRLGQRAIVSGQDFPNTKIPGHVARIAPVAMKSTDASSTAMQVLTTIALEESPSFLKDGMTADVDILTTDIPHAIVVPNDAVMKKGNQSYVFVVVKGIAKKQNIVAGQVGDTQTLVKSGLRPGDVIVALNTPGLVAGAPVKPLPSPSPTASAATP